MRHRSHAFSTCRWARAGLLRRDAIDDPWRGTVGVNCRVVGKRSGVIQHGCCTCPQPTADLVTVSGSVGYLQRIAMPPDALLTGRVEDDWRDGACKRGVFCHWQTRITNIPYRNVGLVQPSMPSPLAPSYSVSPWLLT